MVAFFVEKIKDGTITIDNVSERWREKVREAVIEEEKSIWKFVQDLNGSYFCVKNEERKVRI